MSDISKISAELLKLREEGCFLSDQTFITANNLVNKLYSTAKANNLWWYPPIISVRGRDGGIYLEWQKLGRYYTLFVQNDEIDYYARQKCTTLSKEGKVLPSILVMEEGDINIENDLTEFWEWIAE